MRPRESASQASKKNSKRSGRRKASSDSSVFKKESGGKLFLHFRMPGMQVNPAMGLCGEGGVVQENG